MNSRIKPHLKVVRLGRFRTSTWICILVGRKSKGYGKTPLEAYNNFIHKFQ